MEEESMQRVVMISALLAMMLAACAPKAAPTIDPAQIQASAMAAASTMIALTKAAIPTDTPVPPTPLPSPTPLTLPTAALLPTLANPPAATKAPGGDCNGLFDVGASGPQAPLVIKNNTKGPITFGVKMNTKNSFGQCGYIVFSNIAKGQSVTGSVPLVHTSAGDSCYWGYAIVNDPKHPSNPGGGPWCIDSQLKWTVEVGYDNIKLLTP
jgi:hypothetical protein